MEDKRPTIYDVAELAGVAASTVSRTFARPGRVGPETAAKVRAAADELGYRSHAITQGPVNRRSNLIAMLITDIANPFYPMLIRGAQVAASAEDYEILLVDSRESGQRERQSLERVLPVVDGVIVGSSRMPDAGLRAIAKQRATVVLNREMGDISSVITDNQGGAAAAVDHLYELGHREVTYVSGPDSSWANGARARGVRQRTLELGMKSNRVAAPRPTFEGGLTAGKQLADRPPSAVIAYNDLVAIGVMHTLIGSGISVPDEVSVVGFDDIVTAQLVIPPLTSVAAPIRQIGAAGVQNVLAMIKGATPTVGQAMVMPTQLRVRASTGPRSR